MPIPAEDMPLLFDHYEVERVLGTGATGVVYLAHDVRLGRRVALKTLHSRRQLADDPDSQRVFERFRREAQLCGALVHPNIVTLYDAGYEGQRFTYLAMEFINGESLQSLMRRSAPLPVSAVCKIADDVLQGLAYAHDHGIIHRDVKPANILITSAGQSKIADFGIATSVRIQLGDLTEKGQLLGTPHYMAPEQITGRDIDARSDLFSVGVLLYEMVAGRKPFEGAGLTDVLFSVVNRDPAPIRQQQPSTPEWLAAFVMRLLRKRPEDRFASAEEASRELRSNLITNQMPGQHFTVPALDLTIEHQRMPEDTPTTPIMAEDVPRGPITLDRPVSSRAAFAMILVTVVVSGGVLYALFRQIDDTPTSALSAEQIRTFEQKRSDLREATLLYQVGAYEESLLRFDDYLEEHPQSVVAREYRDRVTAAIKSSKAQPSTIEKKPRKSSPRATRPAARVDKKEQSNARPSAWSRFKSFFRRDR